MRYQPLLALLLSAVAFVPAPSRAGVADTPLPRFTSGSQSQRVQLFTGVIKRNRLQTDFFCTNFDSDAADIGVEIFGPDGAALNDVSTGVGAVIDVAPGRTVTIGTSATTTFLETIVIPLVGVSQGSARILASSPRVRCNAVVVDDATTPPVTLFTLGGAAAPQAGAMPATPGLPRFSDGRSASHSLLIPGMIKRARNETNVFCTSLSTQPVDIGVEILGTDGALLNSVEAGNGALIDVAPGATVTIGSTGTAALLESTVITLPGVAQGMARVVSTSADILCSAAILDAAVTPPVSMTGLPATTDAAVPPGIDLPLPKFAGQQPSVLIQTVPGVVKRGRVESDFFCSSTASAPIDIGVEIFGPDGVRVNDIAAGVGAVRNVAPGATITIGTSATAAFLETNVIGASNISQGSARIVASSSQVRCNSVVTDDAVTPPASLASLGEGVRPAADPLVGNRSLPRFSSGRQATHSLVIPGVVKRGRTQTDFLCTVLHGPVDLGVEIYDRQGVLLNRIADGNGAILAAGTAATITFGTTGSNSLLESVVIAVPGVDQGFARIVATSGEVACSALVLDAGATPPVAMTSLFAWNDLASAPAPTATPTATATATATASLSPTVPPSATPVPPTATPIPPTPTMAPPTATTATTPSPTQPSSRCVGDCDGDAAVTVDEIVRGVNIALGNLGIVECPAMDGDLSDTVTVDEIVRAVNAALRGC